ncbi:MAG: hypothetical protein ACAI25_12080 [Planctomycetota bacterium]
MKIAKAGKTATITLDDRELQLLMWALERANFIDTPPEKQEEILDFAAKALEQIGRS